MTRLFLLPSTGDLRTEICSDLAQLADIGAEWHALWQRSGASIFQSPDWLMACWANRANGDRRLLRVALGWRGEELVAVLPLAITPRQGLRVLEWAARDDCDYCDALLAPDLAPAALTPLWRHICEAGGFDVALLNRLLPDARARALLGPGSASAVALTPDHRREASLRVEGPFATPDSWFEAQSKKMRQNFRRGVAQLGEGAACRFRCLPAGTPLAPILDRLAEFKRRNLAEKQLASTMFKAEHRKLTALAEALDRQGLLRLFVLERDEEIVALSLNFEEQGALRAYITSYDPSWERASPGTLLIVEYIRWAAEHGLRTVDFLCGAEGFKLRFATARVDLGALSGAATWLGRAARSADRWRHSWRRGRGTEAAA